MASTHVTTRSILSSFLPRLSAPTAWSSSSFTTVYSRQLSLPLLPSLGFAIPSAIQLNIPGLVEGIWESILRAVPKKKTSHMKKRHRQYAGKALKDVTALNKCSACGNVKKAHLLCPYCVNEIKGMFNARAKAYFGEKPDETMIQNSIRKAQFKHAKEQNPERSVEEEAPSQGRATTEQRPDASA